MQNIPWKVVYIYNTYDIPDYEYMYIIYPRSTRQLLYWPFEENYYMYMHVQNIFLREQIMQALLKNKVLLFSKYVYKVLSVSNNDP